MSSETIQGRKVAFLTANDGAEQVELTEPWKAVEQAGGTPELLAPEVGEGQAFDHLDKADSFPVTRAVADADPADNDALVLPGGVANPGDLPAFRAKAVEEIAEGRHEAQAASA